MAAWGSNLKFYRRRSPEGKRKLPAISRCLTGAGRRRTRSGQALAGGRIKHGVAQELLGGPGRRIPTQVPVKPLEVGGVIERHLVPAGPMAGAGINDQTRGDVHFLKRGEKFKGLGVR